MFRADQITLWEFSNIPLEHTPDPQPTVYEGILFIWGFIDSWGMLQGYVGVFLDTLILYLNYFKLSFQVSRGKVIEIESI